jgi:hypothetical protein
LAATVRLYAEAVRRLARSNSASFVDLTQVATAEDNRKDPIHLNEFGFKAVAVAITDNLKFGNVNWLDSSQTEPLRQVIVRKNEWWFHRSRPANMAYVFGFRKHEQGQNADEIPQFDALIVEEEKRIAQLRSLRPVAVQEPIPKLISQFAEFTPQPESNDRSWSVPAG